jgi:hypothetical protein
MAVDATTDAEELALLGHPHFASGSTSGEHPMTHRFCVAVLLAAALTVLLSSGEAEAQQAYGRAWGHTYSTLDWNRFYHYPFVYYPQNFWGNEYYRSADSLYHRYPPEMRIPVYNRHWHNYYPSARKFHSGHHFALDVF